MKILAVDDSPSTLALLTKMAGKAGFGDIETTSSGNLALEALAQSDVVFDCLLFDIGMPGIGGIELCSLVRELPAYAKTPIIMMTAMEGRDYIDRAFSAGATDYVNKPLNSVELGARLRMAEELIIAQTGAKSGEIKADRSGSSDTLRHSFELSDEIVIVGVKALIRFNALGNYLAQLSRSGIAESQVIAVKVDQIETIYSKAATAKFIYVLTEVASAISQALRVSGHMMAYAGNGTFVVVLGKVALEGSIGLEVEIQVSLDTKYTQYDDGKRLNISISFGNPIRPSASKNQRVWKTFGRAISRAELRANKKQDELKLPKIHPYGS